MKSLGYVTGNLTKGLPYTFKFSTTVGVWYDKDFQNYLRHYIQNSARLLTYIKKTPIFAKHNVYITIIPIVDNLTSDYFVKIVNEAVNKFRARYAPEFVMSRLVFIDSFKGQITEAIRLEEEEERQKGLPKWAKDLAIIGGVVIVAGVAINALIKR